MAASSEPTIPLNVKTIGFFMAIVGALTFGWNVVSYFKAQELKNYQQDMRLDQVDAERARNIESLNKLTDKTDGLREAVVRLTTVIESGVMNKKAAGDGLLVSPSQLITEAQK